MIARFASSLFVLAALTAGCGSSYRVERDGPLFAVAFPDATALLAAESVPEARVLLATVQLPATDAHHQHLRRALARVNSVRTENLILLTEAVALPVRASGERVGTHSVSVVNGVVTFHSRGAGAYAPVIDELLITGASKLTDPSAVHLGRLVATTQSVDAARELTAKLTGGPNGQAWDDGSPRDLGRILGQFRFKSWAGEYCTEVLQPAGRLAGGQIDVALDHLSHDADAAKVLIADYATRSSLTASELIAHLERFSTDSARADVVEAAARIVQPIHGDGLVRAVRLADFDSTRTEIVGALAPRLESVDPRSMVELLELASFDSGRDHMIEALATRLTELDGRELLAFLQLMSFDSGRIGVLERLAPRVRELSAGETRAILTAFSFDSGRLKTLRVLQRQVAGIEGRDRTQVVGVFTFKSSVEEAREILGWY